MLVVVKKLSTRMGALVDVSLQGGGRRGSVMIHHEQIDTGVDHQLACRKIGFRELRARSESHAS